VAFSPHANYTNLATTAGQRILVPTFADKAVSREEYHYSWMLRLVAFIRTDVSEESNASTISVKRIGELRTTLAVTSNRHNIYRRVRAGAAFFRNVVSYKSHTA
jgi:hypothetical protein